MARYLTLLAVLHKIRLTQFSYLLIIGLNREKLETRLKAAKLRAVAQFATARNNEHHDRQWGLPQAPNSNKEVGVLYNMGEHSSYLIGKITFPRSKFSTYLEGPFK